MPSPDSPQCKLDGEFPLSKSFVCQQIKLLLLWRCFHSSFPNPKHTVVGTLGVFITVLTVKLFVRTFEEETTDRLSIQDYGFLTKFRLCGY